jgi:hypothetical protein
VNSGAVISARRSSRLASGPEYVPGGHVPIVPVHRRLANQTREGARDIAHPVDAAYPHGSKAIAVTTIPRQTLAAAGPEDPPRLSYPRALEVASEAFEVRPELLCHDLFLGWPWRLFVDLRAPAETGDDLR